MSLLYYLRNKIKTLKVKSIKLISITSRPGKDKGGSTSTIVIHLLTKSILLCEFVFETLLFLNSLRWRNDI